MRALHFVLLHSSLALHLFYKIQLKRFAALNVYSSVV